MYIKCLQYTFFFNSTLEKGLGIKEITTTKVPAAERRLEKVSNITLVIMDGGGGENRSSTPSHSLFQQNDCSLSYFLCLCIKHCKTSLVVL